jgi:hypothetical protein
VWAATSEKVTKTSGVLVRLRRAVEDCGVGVPFSEGGRSKSMIEGDGAIGTCC